MKHLKLPILMGACLICFFTPEKLLAQDADGDGMPDSWENAHGCLMANTADDGLDPDSDSMTNLEEYNYSDQMNPCDPDTDGDGLPDGLEISKSTDPLNYNIGSPKNIRITHDSSVSRYPTLSWTGTEFGLVWDDDRDSNREIYFARIGSYGDTVSGFERITFATGLSGTPYIAWTGSEYACYIPPPPMTPRAFHIYIPTHLKSAGYFSPKTVGFFP